MYSLEIKPEADRIFRKLSRKDKKLLRIIWKKIGFILMNPNHDFKFLAEPLQTFNRVHAKGPFVLIFRIEHARKAVVIYYFGHHDSVYGWRPA